MSVYKRKRLEASSVVGLLGAQLDAPKALPLAPAPAPPPSAASLAMREVLQLPPLWITQLPLATTLRCTLANGDAFDVTTSREHYMRQRAAAAIVLTGRELGALAIGAENDRASAAWLASWLAAKRADAASTLDPATALGGIADATTPAVRWPLSRVLHAWQLTLTAVGVGDGPEWL